MDKNKIKHDILNSELEQILPGCFRINESICYKYNIHSDFDFNHNRISVFSEISCTWVDLELTKDEVCYLKLKYE